MSTSPEARTGAASTSPADNVLDAEGRSSNWDTEALVSIVARDCMADPNHPAWSNERFLRWLVEEARSADPRERRMNDAQRALRGRQLQLRVEARRLRMKRCEAAPPLTRAEMVALPAVVWEWSGRQKKEVTPFVDLAVAAGAGRDLWDEPCDQWVVMPDELPSGRYLALKIAGDSMEPVMHTGDTVLVRVGGPIERGTVVIARHPEDGYVCKKVRRVRRHEIELESLKPGLPLIVIPRNPDLVVGTVVLVWCEHTGPSLMASA